MKKAISAGIFAIVCIAVSAQTASIKVEYQDRHTNWTGANKKEKFILLANNDYSRYYNPMTQVVDSMLSTTEGTVQFNAMVEAANAAGQRPSLLPQSRTVIIKSRNEGSMKCYEEAVGELGNYTEMLADQNWTIEPDSVKTILGYECTLANMDYHGRRWRAWFAADIPLQDGPWKLCGLPGLILEADADGGKYRFMATGIEATAQPFPSKIYGHDLSEKMDRKEMRRMTWQFYHNSASQMAAEYGITGMKDDELPEGFDLIETDYK